MTAMLRAEGHAVNRKRVQRLMRSIGIAALGPKPRTTKPARGHKIFPYLLRGLAIERPNQVGYADITYSAPRPTVGEAYDWNAKEKGGLKKNDLFPAVRGHEPKRR
jgi:putative transposase